MLPILGEIRARVELQTVRGVQTERKYKASATQSSRRGAVVAWFGGSSVLLDGERGGALDGNRVDEYGKGEGAIILSPDDAGGQADPCGLQSTNA